MTLKDLLRKREKTKEEPTKPTSSPPRAPPAPEFTFIRSTTNTQELISPPSFGSQKASEPAIKTSSESGHHSRFRSSSNTSTSSKASTKGEKRLSKLRLRSHSHASTASSSKIPTDLPAIRDGDKEGEDQEAQWEERATILAQQNLTFRPTSQDVQPASASAERRLGTSDGSEDRPATSQSISDAQGDVGIPPVLQEAPEIDVGAGKHSGSNQTP